MVNEILMKRICKLIAMTKAISEAQVWSIYEATRSIDEVLKQLSESNGVPND